MLLVAVGQHIARGVAPRGRVPRSERFGAGSVDPLGQGFDHQLFQGGVPLGFFKSLQKYRDGGGEQRDLAGRVPHQHLDLRGDLSPRRIQILLGGQRRMSVLHSEGHLAFQPKACRCLLHRRLSRGDFFPMGVGCQTAHGA